MNISVKHNSSDITQHVIGYEREHKICTSIGTCDVTIDRKSGLSFDPWDSIDIYENGSFKVRYFVSDVEDAIPTGTIFLKCQDNSKRLVDYFISESYTIDYPSYTRTWIELFLTEAGISYEFTTASQGNLLSNYTSLGLNSAYEQILQLLQLSGWFMYFDGDGKAIIGDFEKELSPVDGSLNENDILDIVVEQNDKMLRNRVVVLGSFDPLLNEYASADISTVTRWNYDAQDLRAIVISNSNIPNKSSAYAMANTLLKEFSTITITKTISATGARNFNLGDVLGISSRAYTGKGIITTFSVIMDRNGLITNVVLDERCPRLFGFFNFGDWVYVSTYGSGIWRKHIRYDHTWHDFSQGLDQLAITDLHINNGLFTSVGASGEMYYNLSDDGLWQRITVTGLVSVVDDVPEVTASGEMETIIFSGIMGRATIVDKINSRIVYGVDTFSGINTGDYFLSFSSWFPTVTLTGILTSTSGLIDSGTHRGWIIDYYISSGFDIPTNVYPINVSGNYNVIVLDVENDGNNDYVSVRAEDNIIAQSGIYYNFGYKDMWSNNAEDSNNKVSIAPTKEFSGANDALYKQVSSSSDTVCFVYENEILGFSDLLTATAGRIQRSHVNKIGGTLSETTTQSPLLSSVASGMFVRSISPFGDGDWKIIYTTVPSLGAGEWRKVTLSSVIWDTSTNTFIDNTLLSTWTINYRTNKTSTTQTGGFGYITSNGTFYIYLRITGNASLSIADDVDNFIEVWRLGVNIETNSVSGPTMLLRYDFQEQGTPYSTTRGFDRWHVFEADNSDEQICPVFQMNGGIVFCYFIKEYNEYDPPNDEYTNIYAVVSLDGVSFTVGAVIEETNPSFSWASSGASQTTGSSCFSFIRKTGTDSNATIGTTFLFNGSSVVQTSLASVPASLTASKIFPVFGLQDYRYIAKDGTDFYFCTPVTFVAETLISFPAKYTNIVPFNTTNSTFVNTFWRVFNTDTSRYEILSVGFDGGIQGTIRPQIFPFSFTGTYGTVAGNFFIDIGSSTGVSYLYVDNSVDVKTSASSFMVLQRENLDYNIVRTHSLPLRIDISNYAPVVIAADDPNTFSSHFINGSGVLEYDPPFLAENVTVSVQDFRYSYLTSSGELGTGLQGIYPVGPQNTFFVPSGLITSSGIDTDTPLRTFDLFTMSGTANTYGLSLSGVFNRVEATNYAASGQYIFVTTSGDAPQFYQKDALDEFFIYYSGLPNARATMIRIDDRL